MGDQVHFTQIQRMAAEDEPPSLPKQTRTGFFSLPRELRDKIYKLHIANHRIRPIQIRLRASVRKGTWTNLTGVYIRGVKLNLHRTNLPKTTGLIRDEFFAALFHKVVFEFDCTRLYTESSKKKLFGGPSQPLDFLPVRVDELYNSSWSVEEASKEWSREPKLKLLLKIALVHSRHCSVIVDLERKDLGLVDESIRWLKRTLPHVHLWSRKDKLNAADDESLDDESTDDEMNIDRLSEYASDVEESDVEMDRG